MDINDKMEWCYHCEACVQVCPVHAINLENTRRGGTSPQINRAVCTNCGMCEQVCPLNAQPDEYKYDAKEQHIRAVRRIDTKKRKESQSGGIFSVIAEYLLCHGGIVYGAALNESLDCHYKRIDKTDELKLLKGSKYVQAEVGEVYKLIREDLNGGRKVLFGGTACAVLGLRMFLGKEQEELITCDLICHGVTSPEVYKKYRIYQEKKYGEKMKTFNFRDKAFGWHSHVESFTLDSGKRASDILYRNLYYGHLCMRESCYHCPFADMERVSDITLGDFWGIENIHSEWDDNLGISLVLTNTPKGEAILEKVAGELEFIDSNRDEAMQPHLAYPVQRPKAVELFWDEYRTRNFEYILKKYGSGQRDAAVRKNLETRRKMGIKAESYFVKRNFLHIAVCGLDENMEILIDELEGSSVSVACVLEVACDNAICKKYASGKPLIPMDELNEERMGGIDCYVVTSVPFFLDILKELCAKGVPLYEVVPISFLSAMEI